MHSGSIILDKACSLVLSQTNMSIREAELYCRQADAIPSSKRYCLQDCPGIGYPDEDSGADLLSLEWLGEGGLSLAAERWDSMAR